MQGGDLEGIAAEQHAAQAAAPRVNVLHEHELTDCRGRSVRLPHSDPPGLVADADENRFARAVEVAVVVRGRP